MTDVLIVREIKITFAEGQIINAVEKIGLSDAILPDKTVKFW
jgi:hypothetical protein